MSKRVSNLRETCNNLIALAVIVIVIIWLSVFCYGTFYYFYIPPVSHVLPAYLQFDTTCQTGMCSFPSANVTLVQRSHDQLLKSAQQYKFYLDLEMPESAMNRRLGMFMVKLSIYSQDGVLLKSSFRTSLLHYKSNLLRYLNTLIFSPFLLSGSWEEKQTVSVLMFENYLEHPEFPAHTARIEIHSRIIEVYSANLRILAHFSGLRYYMYYWPVFSALVGIFTNFYFLTLVVLLSWYRILQWHKETQEGDIFAVEMSDTQIPKDQPFTPAPINLDPSEPPSDDNEDSQPESTMFVSTELKKSKENLALRSHSSVQELRQRRLEGTVAAPSNVDDRLQEDLVAALPGYPMRRKTSF